MLAQRAMRQQAVQFTVIDPVFNRKAFVNGGLYTTILAFLKDTPDLVNNYGITDYCIMPKAL
jgi:hypothetical protein